MLLKTSRIPSFLCKCCLCDPRGFEGCPCAQALPRQLCNELRDCSESSCLSMSQLLSSNTNQIMDNVTPQATAMPTHRIISAEFIGKRRGSDTCQYDSTCSRKTTLISMYTQYRVGLCTLPYVSLDESQALIDKSCLCRLKKTY